MLAASNHAGGEWFTLAIFIVLGIALCWLNWTAAIYSPINVGRVIGSVALLAVLSGVGLIGSATMAEGRGETLQAYRDVQAAGFDKPLSLSVSRGKVSFGIPDCIIHLKLRKLDGHYTVFLHTNRPLSADRLAEIADLGCRRR